MTDEVDQSPREATDGEACNEHSPSGPVDRRPCHARFRIIVDRDLCQGHGVCESEAPEVFVVEKKATTVTVLNETPPESQRAAVEAAVRYCPTHALEIEEIQ